MTTKKITDEPARKDTFDLADVEKKYTIPDKKKLAELILATFINNAHLTHISVFKTVVRLSSYPGLNAMLSKPIIDIIDHEKEGFEQLSAHVINIEKFLNDAEKKLNT